MAPHLMAAHPEPDLLRHLLAVQAVHGASIILGRVVELLDRAESHLASDDDRLGPMVTELKADAVRIRNHIESLVERERGQCAKERE